MPNLQYSITFEHDIKPTQTVRGDARTNDPHLALRRALNAIEQAHPRYQWSSFVVVIEKPRQTATSENESIANGNVGAFVAATPSSKV